MSKNARIQSFNVLQQDLQSNKYAYLDLEPAIVVVPVPAPFFSTSKLSSNPHKNNNSSLPDYAQALPFVPQFIEANTIEAILVSNQNNKKSIAALVFSSSKNPGGGIERGSKAQEEDISLVSSWYAQVKAVKGFYNERGDSAINQDKMLYTHKSYILKNEQGLDIAPSCVSFIGACAPNLSGLQSQGSKINEKDIYTALSSRIAQVLHLAQRKNHTTLVLGAWGCGVFGLDYAKVASAFKEQIDKGIYTGNIVFAIPSLEKLNIFKSCFAPNSNKDIKTNTFNLGKMSKK